MMIFFLLERPAGREFQDLRMAALVCCQWRDLATAPGFWRNFTVSGGRVELAKDWPAFLGLAVIRRLALKVVNPVFNQEPRVTSACDARPSLAALSGLLPTPPRDPGRRRS